MKYWTWQQAFDGTWQKRGHTSINGVAFVIDLETGLILDYIRLSKYCHLCSMKASCSDTKSADYGEWFKDHRDSGECQVNFFFSFLIQCPTLN